VRESATVLRHDFQKCLPVLVIDKDVFAPVAAGGDMIDGAGEFDTQRTGHTVRLRCDEAKDKASYLDTVGQPNCNSEVEQAEPQDID